MDLTAGQTVLRADAQPDEPLRGQGVIALAGLAYLGIALSFAFIDRSLGRFGIESLLWAAWAALGFGVRLLAPDRLVLRQRVARVMLVLTALLWIVPAFLAFNLIRWIAVGLLVVLAARAAVLATRRDLYYLLAALIAIAMLILTHAKAQWPIWFYMGPAWLAIGLVLAWDYAAGLPVPAWMKVAGTALFMIACLLLTAAALSLLPRPAMLGFGFLPPGTTTPGRFRIDTPQGPPSRRDGLEQEAAPDGQPGGGRLQPGDGAGGPPGTQRGAGGKAGGVQGSAPGPRGSLPPTGGSSGIEQAVAILGAALQDQHLPGWQRSMLSTLRDALQALGGLPRDEHCNGKSAVGQCVPGQSPDPRSHPNGQAQTLRDGQQPNGQPKPKPGTLEAGGGAPRTLDPWLLILLVALALMLWSRRWRIATSGALAGAWLLRRSAPALSMRWAMAALHCLLRGRGHRLQAGMSMAELVASASNVPAPVRAWLGGAVQTYGLWRFGGCAPRSERADQVRSAVAAAAEVLAHPPKRARGKRAR